MKAKELEIFSEATNSPVVRMPSRRFPGVLIQGDSLSVLFDEAMTIVEALSESKDSEAFVTALEMAERLEAHLLHYEDTLKSHGIDFPYVRDPARSTSKHRHR
jgi:hypothetical protein